MNSFKESLAYFVVKLIAFLVTHVPVFFALLFGRFLGWIGYYTDIKHKRLAYTNLKIAFAAEKNPRAIKAIVKELFQNYGQNLIELLRLPLMHREGIGRYVTLEGNAHIEEALKEKKGVILLAMHFGSWEISSLLPALLKYPYKVLTKPQTKFSRLDQLLNFYRSCGGSVVVQRGMGTRELIKSLRNNEIVGMVVDQGGREGAQVDFFGRQTSLSVGALRLALKLETPICFSVILREGGGRHRIVIHPRLSLKQTGREDEDVAENLKILSGLMQDYVRRTPAEYMWFYKIWKYSTEAKVLILDDGRTGHLRQSQAVARVLQQALAERGIKAVVSAARLQFKNKAAASLSTLLGLLGPVLAAAGGLRCLGWLLQRDSFRQVAGCQPDFVISCGSLAAGVNRILKQDSNCKSICILRPSFARLTPFDLFVLPRHDFDRGPMKQTTALTQGAPNLICEAYLREQAALLEVRFPALKNHRGLRLGVLIGGDLKGAPMDPANMRLVVNQVKEVCLKSKTEILLTTSRRTPAAVENFLQETFRKNAAVKVFISPRHQNVPEAVGGILGLSDVLLVSGDSVSMVSEAAASGKNAVVFHLRPKGHENLPRAKHQRFLEGLHAGGYIFLTEPSGISDAILLMLKNKLKTKVLDDTPAILEGVQKIL